MSEKNLNRPRTHICDVDIDNLTVDRLNTIISDSVAQGRKIIVGNVNINALSIASAVPDFKRFLQQCDYVFCDGHGVMLAARLSGQLIPEKITYAAWLPKLAKHCEAENLSFFLLGGKSGVAEEAAAKMKQICPNLKIAGFYHGFFDKTRESKENRQVIDLINKSNADILIVCMGMPLQEKWLSENWCELNVSVALPAGAALDYVAGICRRPPKFMTDHGLEWLGRLIYDPSRLWKRYLLEMPTFFARLLIKWLAANARSIFETSVIGAILFAIFHCRGNSADVDMYSKSIFRWAMMRWDMSDGNLTYCYLIPFISLFLVFLKFKEMLKAKITTCPKALFLIIGAIILHIIGLRTSLPRLSLASLILLLWSIPLYLCGVEIGRLLLFPCAYLFFCIPLTFLDSLTFPMRLMAASASASLLNGIGIEVQRIGTAIYSLSNDGFALDVADPCSGLRYFLVLMALSAVYANLTQDSLRKKMALFCFAPFIAIAANIIRILLIAIVSVFYDQEIATGVYHDWSGYIVFISAVILLVASSRILNINIKQKLKSWKRRQINTAS